MRALELSPKAEPPRPQPVVEDLFKRDGAGGISEADLRRLLAGPTFLEARTRLGVVSVATGYEPETGAPLWGVPAILGEALEQSGLFELATEVSTDWPADRGLSGLRELAARYRVPYLLLYRERFVDRSWTNGWGWLYPTVIGALAAPVDTVEIAGVVEATLFDVRSGTLLFTVFQRVHDQRTENLWNRGPKLGAAKAALLDRATKRLTTEVVAKARRLAAARPEARTTAPAAAGDAM
jgi:hypothetical protein